MVETGKWKRNKWESIEISQDYFRLQIFAVASELSGKNTAKQYIIGKFVD